MKNVFTFYSLSKRAMIIFVLFGLCHALFCNVNEFFISAVCGIEHVYIMYIDGHRCVCGWECIKMLQLSFGLGIRRPV